MKTKNTTLMEPLCPITLRYKASTSKFALQDLISIQQIPDDKNWRQFLMRLPIC